jgi:hypothetical protein
MTAGSHYVVDLSVSAVHEMIGFMIMVVKEGGLIGVRELQQ